MGVWVYMWVCACECGRLQSGQRIRSLAAGAHRQLTDGSSGEQQVLVASEPWGPVKYNRWIYEKVELYKIDLYYSQNTWFLSLAGHCQQNALVDFDVFKFAETWCSKFAALKLYSAFQGWNVLRASVQSHLLIM